ncbi:MAG: DoxX family protein [Mycobacteriaceae bacterium]|nr:DoxX family protein [Mycobacteriaceae bacterium]NBQ43199.1 DoxX family protein [Mycobacteriaceae bacterium]
MTPGLHQRLDRSGPAALALFRIVIGLLFALHGTAKLFGWPATKSGAVPVGTWPYWWAGVIELAVGVLVALGLFTRIAAVIGSGTMAFAYFTEHQAKGLLPIENGGELATLYCFAFLLIALIGPGAFALRDRGPDG